jgi:hypothetical protein
MPNIVKQILAGFMIAGDALLMFFAFAMALEPYSSERGVYIFMILFLAVDAWLTIDYIIALHHQTLALQDQAVEEHVAKIKNEAEEEKLESQRDQLDDALAEDVRRADMPDPEELKDMLAKDHLTEQEAKK